MADVTVEVAGRSYLLSCEDGEEPHLIRLIGQIGQEADTLQDKFVTPIEDSRLMLMVALVMADRADEAETKLRQREAEAPKPARGPSKDFFQEQLDAERAGRVTALAERIETLSRRLIEG
ncbi:MAG: cell division protein ZapA [Paracoccaceae bacterium]